MPSLGVSGNTPFSQGTNYHTARNHSFRDSSSYSVKAQMRIKCPSCGIWGLRGTNCKLCNTLVPGNAAIFAKPGNRSGSPSMSHRSASGAGGASPRVGTAPRSTTPGAGSRKPVYVQRPASRTPKRVAGSGAGALRRIDPNATTPTMQKMGNHNNHDDQYQQELQDSVNVQYPGTGLDMQDERTRALAEVFGDVAPLQPQQQRQQPTQHQQQQQQSFNIHREDRTQSLAERFGEAPRSSSSSAQAQYNQQTHMYQLDEDQQPMMNPHAQFAARSASAASYGKGSIRSASARSSSGGGAPLGGGNGVAPAKVKCHYCGVWVAPNRMCALCRTPN